MNTDLLTLMETRRSVRRFKPDMLPSDVIDQIIKAGTYAATGMNRQSPHYHSGYQQGNAGQTFQDEC